VWGVWGVWGVCGVWGVWGTFDIPQTALVATLDTYDFLVNGVCSFAPLYLDFAILIVKTGYI
jgi:hypothetical protein